ncbi:MAG TPA: Do family serine endopeptidase [Paracoccaceae bacterium]|nr:Do family serine endopeptidase [Paracoccaceae bacterium]
MIGESLADLVEDISPAVVNITTSVVIPNRAGPAPIVPEGSPLEDLFRDFLDRRQQQPQQRRGNALGSGFVISADGFIVTNNHVIENADTIEIEFNDGQFLQAEIIGRDEKTDIALLKVDTDKALPFVSFGDSDIARVGDWVLAIGNPLGQGFSVSAGIISARNRELSGAYDDFIQTDAAINRGNSGGPLFNMMGEVIGVNTAILSPNGGSIGIGFSMASNVVSEVVDQLMKFGETRRGWLGVRIQNISEDIAEAMGLENTNGALVTDVPEGPAKVGGIERGDVITSFDGKEIAGVGELVRIVGGTEVGKTVRVIVLRDGRTQTLKVEVGRLEEAETAALVAPEQAAPETLQGMELGVLDEETRNAFNIPDDIRGVLVLSVEGDSEAFTKGIRGGDVIAEVGQQPVRSPSDVVARVAEAAEAGRKSVLLLVNRGGDESFIAISIE